MSSRKYKSAELVEMLRGRFDDLQRYALFEQVANGTGYNARSWVDAVVLYLWPSDGLLRCAFEVKVSRQDFLAELKNPKKNEWAREACHEFWFVAPKDVIKEQELPEGVGWMRPHGDKLVIVRHAKRSNAKLSEGFLASIARSVQKVVKADEKKIRKKVLSEDKDYNEALKFKSDVEAFVRSRGKRTYDMCMDGGVEKVLAEIAAGDKATVEASHIMDVLGSFQNNMAEIFEGFVPLAYMSMVETDKLGEFIVSRYGSDGEAPTIAEKRALLAKPKKQQGFYGRSGAKKIIGAFDRMKRMKERQDGKGHA